MTLDQQLNLAFKAEIERAVRPDHPILNDLIKSTLARGAGIDAG